MNGSYFKFILSVVALVVFVLYYWLTGNSQKQYDKQFVFLEGVPELSLDFFTINSNEQKKEKIDSVVLMYETYADSGLYLLKFSDSIGQVNHQYFITKEHTNRDSIGYKKWKDFNESQFIFETYRCFTISGQKRYFYVSWNYFEDVKMYPLDYLNEENILKIRNHLMDILPPEMPVKMRVLKKDMADSLSLDPITVYEIFNSQGESILKDNWSLDRLKKTSVRSGPMDWEEEENPDFMLWYEPFMFKLGLFFIGIAIFIFFFSWEYLKGRLPVFTVEPEISELSFKWEIRKREKAIASFEIPVSELSILIYTISTSDNNSDYKSINGVYGIVFKNNVTNLCYNMIAKDYAIDSQLIEKLKKLPKGCIELNKAKDVLELKTAEGHWTHTYITENDENHIYHSRYLR